MINELRITDVREFKIEEIDDALGCRRLITIKGRSGNDGVLCYQFMTDAIYTIRTALDVPVRGASVDPTGGWFNLELEGPLGRVDGQFTQRFWWEEGGCE